MTERKGMKGHWKTVAGFAATVFFLWLTLRGVRWSEVAREVRNADFALLGGAILISTLGMHVRAMRWKTLLEPVAPGMPWQPRIAGVCIGFAANNIFPARLGEFARTWVLSRQSGVPLTAAFASLVVERALDGIVMIVFLLGAMSMPGFPDVAPAGGVDVRAAARFVAAVSGVMLLGLLWMAFFPRPAVRMAEAVAARVLPERLRRPVVDALHAFLGGLHVLRSPRLLAASVLWAVGQWAFLATSFVLAFRAFGITGPGYLGAVFLQSCIALAVAFPAAPGFFGVFHAAAVGGLALWGVPQSQAVSFAFGFHLGGWLTVTGMGMYYAARLNVRWGDLRRSEDRVETAVEGDPSLAPDARPV